MPFGQEPTLFKNNPQTSGSAHRLCEPPITTDSLLPAVRWAFLSVWRCAPGLRPLEAHLLIGSRKIEERDEADRRLVHTRSDAIQHRPFQERGMHHTLVHEGRQSMQ